MPSIQEILPALYSRLLPERIRVDAPVETKATCGKCAMCEPTFEKAAFRPDTKCCTFQPKLPNYLVGAILADHSPEMAEGRARILEKIQAGAGVSPLGLSPPAKFNLLYSNTRGFFGKSASMRCPFYQLERGNCTIWRYREAVCSTWFCKYDAGDDGRKFWTALKKVLSLAEIQISRYAVLQLHRDFILQEKDRPAASGLSLDDLEDRAESEEQRFQQWGLWLGREEAFYLKCHELVLQMDTQKFTELMGLDGEIWNEILLEAHRKLSDPKLPHRLGFNPEATTRRLPDGTIALGFYSEYDAVAVPKPAFDLISELTAGKTVEETRREWRETRQTDLSDEMLLILYQHRILIESP